MNLESTCIFRIIIADIYLQLWKASFEKKNAFFCVGEYAEYGFDQHYSDEGLTLETSAKHYIPQAKNIPYQPL